MSSTTSFSAAAGVCEEREIVVIGSQAILGSVEEPPPSMLVSMEADVYPLGNPGKAIEIEGALVLAKCAAGRDRD